MLLTLAFPTSLSPLQTVDAEQGESLRCKRDIDAQIRQSGYPREEIEKGLWPAVTEFVGAHPEWSIAERFTHNNGLTILARSA